MEQLEFTFVRDLEDKTGILSPVQRLAESCLEIASNHPSSKLSITRDDALAYDFTMHSVSIRVDYDGWGNNWLSVRDKSFKRETRKF